MDTLSTIFQLPITELLLLAVVLVVMKRKYRIDVLRYIFGNGSGGRGGVPTVANADNQGGGGGSGAFVVKTISASLIGTTETYVVGGGGGGGAGGGGAINGGTMVVLGARASARCGPLNNGQPEHHQFHTQLVADRAARRFSRSHAGNRLLLLRHP